MKRISNGLLSVFAGIGLMCALAAPSSAAVAYTVTVNTSAVNGTSGFLDFQFNPGNATSQPATAQIANFQSTGGALTGVPAVTGNVSGTLPGTVTFVNSTALNEYFQGYNYGTSFTFLLILSGPAIDAPNGTATAGSTFCVGLYDAAQNPILTNQAAVTGCAGAVDINLNGSTTATAFPNANGGPSVVTFALVPSDSYLVSYAANLLIGDSYVNLTNAGVLNGFDPAGRICVNVYTFDPSEELISCCACPVTPDGLKSLSAKQDLVSNTLTPGVPSSVVIKLLASVPVGGACNAATPTVATLGHGVKGWATSLHQNTINGNYEITENVFQTSVLSDSELAKLTTYCGFIQSNGSGFGICKSCRLGGLGGAQQ